MAQVDEIAVKLGLKTADFKASLKAAGVDVNNFKKQGAIGENEGFFGSLKNLTQRLSQFRSVLLGGGIGAAAAGVFRSAVTYAEKYKGAVNDGVGATLRLRDAMLELGVTSGQIGTKMIGWAEELRLRYILMFRGTKAFIEASKSAAVANEKVQSVEIVKKVTEETEKLAKARADNALAGASNAEKIIILEEEEERLLKRQEAVRGDIVEFLKQQVEIEKVQADIFVAAKAALEDEAELRAAIYEMELAQSAEEDELAKKNAEGIAKRKKALKDELEMREEILKSFRTQIEAEDKLSTAQDDRTKKTLRQIAVGGGGTTGTNQAIAREIERLDREAIRSRAGGFNDSANRRADAADALRLKLAPVLKSSDVDPLEREKNEVSKASRDFLKNIESYLKPKELS